MNKVWIGLGLWVVVFLVSYVCYEGFFVGFAGWRDCPLLSWLALWGLLVVGLVIIAVMVEVLRER